MPCPVDARPSLGGAHPFRRVGLFTAEDCSGKQRDGSRLLFDPTLFTWNGAVAYSHPLLLETWDQGISKKISGDQADEDLERLWPYPWPRPGKRLTRFGVTAASTT
jgi:hypothetical protein